MRSIPWKQLLLSFGIVAVIVWRVPFAGLRSAFRSLEAGSLFLALFFCSLHFPCAPTSGTG